jgi:uncharacterized protein YukE
MKFAQAVVNQVTDTMMQQINTVITKVQNPLTEMIAPSLETIWQGGSADEFRRQVQQMVKTDLEPSVQILKVYHNGVNDAARVILDADKQVGQMVSDLNTEFGKIY